MSDNPIRIGILGAAKIAPSALIKPASKSPDVVVQAVAARSIVRATEFAGKHGIAHIGEDYQALIARDDLDLIYNPLPPSEHAHWTIEALRAGKHVLCEKPFAMNAEEAKVMVDEAKRQDRHLIEAFHYRFHGLFDRVRELLPELGRLTSIHAEFCFPIPNRKGEFRYIRELGGGALMDLGCYPIHFARSIVREEPKVTYAAAGLLGDGTDHSMAMDLAFPSGVAARLHCSMKTWRLPKIKATLIGSEGSMQVTNFVVPHLYNRIKLETKQRQWRGKVTGKSTYGRQLQHVVSVVRGQADPITGGADAIANMRVIDAAYALARTGGTGTEG